MRIEIIYEPLKPSDERETFVKNSDLKEMKNGKR